MASPAVARTLVPKPAPSIPSEGLAFSPWPYFEDQQIEAVAAVLRSGKVNYWTGDEGRQFETEFARYVGCKYAVCLANGTVALELALHTLGIGPGDEVITTPRTFIASASSVVMRGARPVCVDVDPRSQNITADTIRPAITNRTKAIIAVHLAGWPCDLDPILELAAEHNLAVIEDCAQAHGATYNGRQVGSLGHISAFSFCQDKILTTGGEGGMITTNNKELWERAWSYKDHGKSYDAVYRRDHPPGFRWLHESFGTNWRMTEMQSSLGRQLLRKLPEWLAIRRKHAAQLTGALTSVSALRIPEPPSNIEHAYYKYYAFVRPERLKASWDRDRVMAAINEAGVPCSSGSCSEIYLERAFPPEMRPARCLPTAHGLGKTSLMFVVHPTLTDRHMQFTAETVARVMKRATA
jgi:dTDP-4-amino-4,6-dideoxygalactose transaminase